MSAERKRHWEQVYSTRAPDQVGWYQAHPDLSLALVAATGVGKDAAIIDVGGGASRLVDVLDERGFADLTVLDISASALQAARQRMGERAGRVAWLLADVVDFTPPRCYDVWHDRAVFHFLTVAAHRQRYLEAARAALAPGGHLIMATFALDGPAQCSGLDVVRYCPESLAAEMGIGFDLVESFRAMHLTPANGEQSFTFCRFVRTAR